MKSERRSNLNRRVGFRRRYSASHKATQKPAMADRKSPPYKTRLPRCVLLGRTLLAMTNGGI